MQQFQSFLTSQGVGYVVTLILLVVASVRNSGVPTVAEGFETVVRLSDGTEVATEPIDLPQQMTLQSDAGDEVILGQDALYRKTVNPIPAGNVVRGRLLYFVRGWTH